MSLLQEINKMIDTRIPPTLDEIVDTNNSKIIEEASDLICETAIEFLSVFAAKLKLGHKVDAKDHATKDACGILAALDLLRYPQARKVVDNNSMGAYMRTMLDVQGIQPLDPLEIKLLQNLHRMTNDHGVNGLDIQHHYLDMVDNDPKTLLNIIAKLKAQYTEIMNKLRHQSSTYATHPSTDIDQVI